MYKLASLGLNVDLELRKKLNELLDLRHKFEDEKINELNPIKEQEIEESIKAIDEVIGKIRYISLDGLDILGKKESGKEENAQI
jgi:hypothetical protein